MNPLLTSPGHEVEVTLPNAEHIAVPDLRAAKSWTFLSNHGHVLLAIAGDPEVRLRDIASRVGITERAVQLIVADLVAGDYIVREKVGRRNRYRMVPKQTFRHPAEQSVPLDALLEIFHVGAPVD